MCADRDCPISNTTPCVFVFRTSSTLQPSSDNKSRLVLLFFKLFRVFTAFLLQYQYQYQWQYLYFPFQYSNFQYQYLVLHQRKKKRRTKTPILVLTKIGWCLCLRENSGICQSKLSGRKWWSTTLWSCGSQNRKSITELCKMFYDVVCWEIQCIISSLIQWHATRPRQGFLRTLTRV